MSSGMGERKAEAKSGFGEILVRSGGGESAEGAAVAGDGANRSSLVPAHICP
jgi:hypothetical protein